MADPAVIGRRHVPAMKSLELSVEGMTCAACSGAVARALEHMPGVKEVSFRTSKSRDVKGNGQVEVNLLRGRARVSFDEEVVTAEVLREEVDLIGFDAQVLSVSEAVRRLQRVELSVQGMTCAACSGAVERALSKLEGVLEVQERHKPLTSQAKRHR